MTFRLFVPSLTHPLMRRTVNSVEHDVEKQKLNDIKVTITCTSGRIRICNANLLRPQRKALSVFLSLSISTGNTTYQCTSSLGYQELA